MRVTCMSLFARFFFFFAQVVENLQQKRCPVTMRQSIIQNQNSIWATTTVDEKSFVRKNYWVDSGKRLENKKKKIPQIMNQTHNSQF